MPKRLKKNLPQKPKHEKLQNAYIIITNSNKACSALLKQFEDIRKFRKAKGTPTDAEQDLLRAMLVFACAGLDSMVKQLVRDALPIVIIRDRGAEEVFIEHTKKTMYGKGNLNIDLLLRSIIMDDHREALVQDLVFNLTAGSLQSVDELFRVASFFNIASKDLSGQPAELRKVFSMRNQISHEMDIDFGQRNRNRRPRARDTMIDNVNLIFGVAKVFLEETQKKMEKHIP